MSLVNAFYQNLIMSIASSVVLGYPVHVLQRISLNFLYIKLGAEPEWSTWSWGH